MNPDILRLILPEKTASAHAVRRFSDPDRELLLPIIILLVADRGDFFLILSLVYILL